MKKVYILLIIFLFFSLIFVINNLEIKENDAIEYLNQNDFKTISFEKFLSKSIKLKLGDSYDNYMLEKFIVGLSNTQEIRTMTCYITKKSILGYKRYCIFYDKESNYLKIKEKELDNKEYKDSMIAKEFLNTFDSMKEKTIFPQGKYDYYCIQIDPVSKMNYTISESDSIYVWEDNKLNKLNTNCVVGIGIFVYGEPIRKNDNYIYYFIR